MLGIGLCMAMVTAIAGCTRSSTGPSHDVRVPISTGTWTPGDRSLPPSSGGVLRADSADCLYYRGQAGKWNLMWPAGYRAERNVGGLIEVKNVSGETVAREGRPFVVGAEVIPVKIAPKGMVCLAEPTGVVVVIQGELPPLSTWLRPDSHVVTLYHCGVDTTDFEGREWEVPTRLEPFDDTNAPPSFVGRGTMVRVDEDSSLYTDESGVKIEFRPAEQVTPRGFCA